MAGTIDTRLKELGISLPALRAPAGSYLPFVHSGCNVFLAGQVSFAPGGPRVAGKLGGGTSVEDGYQGARLCALNLLAALQAACGEIGRAHV